MLSMPSRSPRYAALAIDAIDGPVARQGGPVHREDKPPSH